MKDDYEVAFNKIVKKIQIQFLNEIDPWLRNDGSIELSVEVGGRPRRVVHLSALIKDYIECLDDGGDFDEPIQLAETLERLAKRLRIYTAKAEAEEIKAEAEAEEFIKQAREELRLRKLAVGEQLVRQIITPE